MKIIHLKFKQSAWEYFKLNIKFLLQSNVYKLLILLALIYSLITPSITYDNSINGFSRELTFLNVIGFVFMVIQISFIFIFASLIITLLRIIKFRKIFDEDIEYFIDKDKFISQNKYVKSEFKWDFIKKVRRSSRVFMLYTHSVISPLHYIPERAFQTKESLDSFIELIKAKNIKFK